MKTTTIIFTSTAKEMFHYMCERLVFFCRWQIILYTFSIINPLRETYLPNVSFSPESGGSVNPSRAIDEIKTHGTIKLKK